MVDPIGLRAAHPHRSGPRFGALRSEAGTATKLSSKHLPWHMNVSSWSITFAAEAGKHA